MANISLSESFIEFFIDRVTASLGLGWLLGCRVASGVSNDDDDGGGGIKKDEDGEAPWRLGI